MIEDERVREIAKIFRDSFTEAIMLFENPDMGGKNYGRAVMKLRDAYRKLPTLLSLLEEKEKQISYWKHQYDLELAHSQQAEARIKELGIEFDGLHQIIEEQEKKIEELTDRILRMIRGEFKQICSYCGWESEAGQWEELENHLKECHKHPLRQLEARIQQLTEGIEKLLRKVNAVTAPHRHGNPIPKSALDDLSNRQIEVEELIGKE